MSLQIQHHSVVDAQISTGVSSGGIVNCCIGSSNSCAGYVWRYDGDSFDTYFDNIHKNHDGYISKIKNSDYIREIRQYDLSGNLINTYKTVYDIETEYYSSNQRDRTRENVLRCCNHKINKSYGYVWRFEDDPFTYEIRHPNKWRKIIQCAISGEFIKEWESITDVEKEFHIKLCEVLSGRNKSAGGYRWYYADNYYGGVTV